MYCLLKLTGKAYLLSKDLIGISGKVLFSSSSLFFSRVMGGYFPGNGD